MDNFDNIFKNNFQGEEQSISDAEENQLWDSIVEELGEDNSIAGVNKSKLSGKLLLFLLAVVLIPGAYFIGANQAEKKIEDKNEILNDNSSKKTIKKLSELESENRKKQSENYKELDFTNDKITIEELEESNSTPISIVESLKTSNEILEENVNISNSKVISFEEELDFNTSQSSAEILLQAIPQKTKINQVSNKGQQSIVVIEEEDLHFGQDEKSLLDEFSRNSQEGEIDLVSNLAYENAKSNQERPLISDEYLLDFTEPEVIRTEKNKHPDVITEEEIQPTHQFYIGFMGGPNRSGIIYNGAQTDLVNLKNNTERPYWGQTIGIDIAVEYKHKWALSSGIYFEDQKTVLDVEYMKDLDQELKSHLAGILIDHDSKEVIQEYIVDTSILSNSYNRLKHINSFRSFNIPINIAWINTRGRWNYGLSVGAIIRFRINQSAKLYDINREILDLDNNSNLFNNPLNVGLNISPFVEYKLTNSVGVKMAYDLSFYRPVISLDQSIKLTNVINTFKLGVIYHL